MLSLCVEDDLSAAIVILLGQLGRYHMILICPGSSSSLLSLYCQSLSTLKMRAGSPWYLVGVERFKAKRLFGMRF